MKKPTLLWFCPNGTCYRNGGRKYIGTLSAAPESIPICRGTNVTNDEVMFLNTTGLNILDFLQERRPLGSHPNMKDLKIIVDGFQERVSFDDPHVRLKTWNGRDCGQRIRCSGALQKRILSATQETMQMVDEKTVVHGNG